MLFVASVTLVSLVLLIREAFFVPEAKAVVQVNGAVSVVLLVIALSLFMAGGRVLLSRDSARPAPAV
jgi:hypothetical protein